MSVITTPLPIAATASIVASAWASGTGASVSFFTITPILKSSASREVMLQQWQLAYNRGKAFMPPLAGAIALSYFYLSYAHYARQLEWRGFAAAGALTIGIVPFTFIFIMGNIRQLEAAIAKKDAKTAADQEARNLLTTWSRLNIARAMLPLVGTVAAVWNLFA